MIAPFTGLDTLCVNKWWNRRPSPIVPTRVPRDEVIAFGIYTVSSSGLKLSAQLFPLYPGEPRTVRLELKRHSEWREVARATVNDLGWSALLRVADWDSSIDTPYRIRHGQNAVYEGLVRKDPVDKREIVVAALSCNSSNDRGLRPNYVRNINHHDPDLVFFAGDQSYDHRQHTAAWLKFGLQFRDVFRDRPCVTIPDDHDIGQPNLWGEGGKLATRKDGSDGGYNFHPAYVRMVERCQTAHLPDPYDPTPIERGIGVYYTSLVVGGVDFAIIEDRKFKSGPANKIPQQGPRPDHVTDADYDPKALDQPGLTLLGKRQLDFLEHWGRSPGNAAFKVVLSQTSFCGGPHLHGPRQERLYADLDSNGWPQSGRDRAVRLLREAGAVHLAGDQHIAMLVEYGVDEHRDAGWSFAVPAIVNSIYSRWWRPTGDSPGLNRNAEDALPWTGDYLDGFGNKITMHAYANPETQSRGAGYGLIRFDKSTREVTFECWPRDADVTQADAKQFPGWPRTAVVPRP
ncbi:MAG: metallophosphoesterase family protein [Planctomycetota bacterium]